MDAREDEATTRSLEQASEDERAGVSAAETERDLIPTVLFQSTYGNADVAFDNQMATAPPSATEAAVCYDFHKFESMEEPTPEMSGSSSLADATAPQSSGELRGALGGGSSGDQSDAGQMAAELRDASGDGPPLAEAVVVVPSDSEDDDDGEIAQLEKIRAYVKDLVAFGRFLPKKQQREMRSLGILCLQTIDEFLYPDVSKAASRTHFDEARWLNNSFPSLSPRNSDSRQNEDSDSEGSMQPASAGLAVSVTEAEADGLTSRERTMAAVAARESRWLEQLEGTFMTRVLRRGPIRRAIRLPAKKRCFVWLSSDFRHLYCSHLRHETEAAGSKPQQEESSDAGDSSGIDDATEDTEEMRAGISMTGGLWGGRKAQKVVAIRLEEVITLEYGPESRSWRLQKAFPTSKRPPNFLCFSIGTKKRQFDLEAPDESEVRKWVLALHAMTPFSPNKGFITPSEFDILISRLKKERAQPTVSTSSSWGLTSLLPSGQTFGFSPTGGFKKQSALSALKRTLTGSEDEGKAQIHPVATDAQQPATSAASAPREAEAENSKQHSSSWFSRRSRKQHPSAPPTTAQPPPAPPPMAEPSTGPDE